MHLLILLLWWFGIAFVAEHEGEQKLENSQNSVDSKYDSVGTCSGPLSFSEERLYYPTRCDGTACRACVAEQCIPGKDVAAYLFRRKLSECGLLNCSEWTDFVATGC